MQHGRQAQGQSLSAWVMDEHRIGLKPVLHRVWSLRGHRPTVRIHPRYQWLYIYAFAQPSTGRSFYLLMPTVSIEAFSLALHEFVACVGCDEARQILLLLDNAGWHASPKVQRPPGLSLRFLPPYSPELQPAEHLWQLTDRPLFNRCFETLDDLEAILIDHCCWLEQQLDLVRSATCFDWWPKVA